MQMKIMIVDDNPDIVYSVKKGLEALNQGYEVVGAEGGIDCIQKLDTEKPDLILLDIMMPDMDGWDVVAKIREDVKFMNTPIIFLTAKDDELSKGMAKYGVDDYIVKPISPQELDVKIKNRLK
jgi:DNA-binding response OmpR family regulator